jgi:GTPase SAR1 family protein
MSQEIIDKGNFPRLPLNLMVVGNENCGKHTLVNNLLLRIYVDDFKGSNIYIVSNKISIDLDWRDLRIQKQIPMSNIMEEYKHDIYDRIKENYDNNNSEHSLIICDHEIIDEYLACNARHYSTSIIYITNRYRQIPDYLRQVAKCFILYRTIPRDISDIWWDNGTIEEISDIPDIWRDHGIIDKKTFDRAFKRYTKDDYSFFVINYDGKRENRFLDSHFEPIEF